MIVKRVSGQSLRVFADSNIFKPLGMTHTHFHDDHTMIVPNRTSAYQPRTGAWRVSIPVFDTYGATSLFTTADDLLLWEQNFVDPRVGSRSMFAAGLYRNPLNDATQRLAVRDGKLMLGPQAGTALTPIDANRFLSPGGPAVFEIVPAAAGRPQVLRVLVEGQKPVVFEQVPAFAPSSAELSAFAGSYLSAELDIVYTVAPRDSGLVIQTRKGADVILRPTFTDAFVGGAAGLVKFTRDARGAVTGFTVNTGRVRSVRFDRVKG